MIKTKINNDFFINSFKVYFILLLLEGIVRKYLSNQFTIEYIVIRDFILIGTTLYGIKHGFFKDREVPERILFSLTFFVLIWIIIQIILGLISIKIGLIGFRNWILFYWFALVFSRAVDFTNLKKIFKLVTITFIPISILGIIQYNSPIESIVNKQVYEDGMILQVIEGVIRPSSVFTFTYNFTQYLTFITPIILGVTFLYDEVINKKIYKFLVLILLFLITASSGSRGFIFYFFIIFSIFLILTQKNKSIFLGIFKVILMGLCFLLFFYIFNDYFKPISIRFVEASTNENVIIRILHMMLGSLDSWSNITLFGNGLGLGSNLARPYVSNNNFFLGEFDSDRILNEGGLLGIIFFILKIILIYVVISKCIKLKNINYIKYIFSSLFAIYIIHQLLFGSITGHTISNAFTILGISIFFVISKIDIKFTKQN